MLVVGRQGSEITSAEGVKARPICRESYSQLLCFHEA